MLFLVFGSSGAGKTVALNALRGRIPNLAIHDFDEIGVPPQATRAWRHRANQEWIRRALDYQTQGIDLLLAGQTPLGELLAAPSTPLLDDIAACLIDCDDETRIARLGARGPEWLERAPGELQDFLNWAEWMRGHARDPSSRQDVIITDDSAADMRWERWTDWKAGDARWRVHVIDTTDLPVDRVADELAAWVERERRAIRQRA